MKPRAPGAAAVFLVAAVMLFWHLGGPALMQPDEGRNAEIAREMAATGSWLVPTLEGLPYLDKPAFYFRLGAISIDLLGTNEWGARMPSAILGLAILGLMFGFLRRRYDAPAAAAAVAALATSPLFFAFARIVIMDVALTLFVALAIVAAFAAEEKGGHGRSGRHIVAAVAAALATLVKGPVGFLVPALVLVVFFVADGRPGALRRVFAPLNFVVFFALVLPWFVGLVAAHPDFLHYGLVEESFNRFFKPVFARGQPAWYYGPVLIVGVLTWAVLLPGAAWAAWRSRGRWTSTDRLLFIWTVVVFAFFSFSRTKQPGYVLPGIVALGGLFGRVFGLAWSNPHGRASRVVTRSAAALGGAALLLASFLAAATRGPADSWRLVRLNPLDASWLPGFASVMIGALAITALLGVASQWRRDARLACAAFVVLPISIFTVGYPGVLGYSERRSIRPLAERLRRLPADVEIASVNVYPSGLSFYLGRTITVVSDDGSPLRSNYIVYALARAGRPPNVVREADLEAWLDGRRGDTYVLVRDQGRDLLRDLARSRGVAVEDQPGGWQGALLPRPGAR